MRGEENTLVGGRYRLLESVGQGGMGRVWRAHDETLDRQVALKEILLRSELEEEQREHLLGRVRREARAAARLNHPGIVTVHDVVEHRGMPLIVMEFVAGRSLGAVLREEGRLPVERAAAIGTAVLEALLDAHAVGVVHRDVKPDNVLLAERRVVLTDFGIASIADAATALTRSGTVLGTPGYMAPEQLDGGVATAASDLWALGATLYAAVEGRTPFHGPTHAALLYAVCHQPPRPVEHAGPLAPLLERLLTKDPVRRASGQETAAALAALAGPVRPAPPAEPSDAVPSTPDLPATAPLTAPADAEQGTGTDAGLTAVVTEPDAAPATPEPAPEPAPEPTPEPALVQSGARERRRRRSPLAPLAALLAVVFLAVGGWYLLSPEERRPAGAAGTPSAPAGPSASPEPEGSAATPSPTPSAASPGPARTGQADRSEERDEASAPSSASADSPRRTGKPEPGPEATVEERPDAGPEAPDQPPADPGAPGRLNCTSTGSTAEQTEDLAGAGVEEVQCLLRHNYGHALAQDGIFGPRTTAAVKEVQRCSGLRTDGKVGPRTWAVLRDPVPECVP